MLINNIMFINNSHTKTLQILQKKKQLTLCKDMTTKSDNLIFIYFIARMTALCLRTQHNSIYTLHASVYFQCIPTRIKHFSYLFIPFTKIIILFVFF